MQYAKISGTGKPPSANRVSNDDLAKKVDTSDEWITTRTGIKFRHIADDSEKTKGFGRRAGAAPWQMPVCNNDIDLIIVATANS